MQLESCCIQISYVLLQDAHRPEHVRIAGVSYVLHTVFLYLGRQNPQSNRTLDRKGPTVTPIFSVTVEATILRVLKYRWRHVSDVL